MKKILLSLTLITLTMFGYSQTGVITGGASNCELLISNVAIQITDTTCIDATHSTVTFNIQFDLKYNGGNKFIYFHAFRLQDYVASFDCGKSGAQDPPTETTLGRAVNEIGKSFLDIGLDNSPARGALGVAVPINVLSTYAPDGDVVLTSSGIIANKTATATANVDRFSLTGVTIELNQACNDLLEVKTDIWSTNGQGTKAQCFICGLASTFNDPTARGVKNCDVPRTYNLNITTGNTSPIDVVYEIIIDVNNDGAISNLGGVGGDILAYTSPTISLYNGPGTTGDIILANQTYLPYSTQQSTANYDLLVRVTGAGLKNAIVKELASIDCIPLPVKFKSFNATRTTSSNVAITWTTASEQNSKGFNVQKNVGGEWKTVAFIFSQAEGGNSSSDLSYSFKDVNTEKGITQYRIQQVDLDGNAKYSDIKAIRGESAASKIVVYPNPSVDGKVNVVFEDNNVRDIQVNDMQGRIIKSYKGITNNILVIDRLTSGFYTIKITNRNTAASSVEKVVVK